MLPILVKFVLVFNFISRTLAINATENTPSREHKIHNIVLYPDKHSWCRATAIIQEVSHPGCRAVKTDNNVCVGACFSYIVPRTVPETPGDVLPYCDSCQPGHVTWKKVTLECNEGTYKHQNLTKYVEYIHDCNCVSCKDPKSEQPSKEEDVELEDDSSNDSAIGDYLLNTTLEVNQISPNSSQSEFKTIISGLLKTLSNEDQSVLENEDSKGLHRNVWKNLLEKVAIVNNSLESSKFDELVKSVEDESKIKFNYKRLKQALLRLKKYENVTKNSDLINRSLDSIESLVSSNKKITQRSFSYGNLQEKDTSYEINMNSNVQNKNLDPENQTMVERL